MCFISGTLQFAKYTFLLSILSFIMLTGTAGVLYGQVEFTTWGNLTGIRVDGQLMKFESSLCIANADWSKVTRTAREKQRIQFSREGNKKKFSYNIDSLNAVEIIEATGTGLATLNVQFTSRSDTALAGAFLRIDLPGDYYSGGSVQVNNEQNVTLKPKQHEGRNEYAHATAKHVRFISPAQQLDITLLEPAEIFINDDRRENNDIRIYMRVLGGTMKTGQTGQNTFTLKASGKMDKDPVRLTLDTSKPGRPFAGIGGNFRLQNPEADPPVINYCLENLRVSWARVEMPWRFWHPEEDKDPILEAGKGNLHPRVQAAMEMAKRLYNMGIPIIVSDWSAPDWAIQGTFSYRPQPDGLRGNPLNTEKMNSIYESITAYLIYLKEHYGVEVAAFSFNESDLGINIRQTPAEHVKLIKELGAYLASKGLRTKLLLGDTADVNGWPFIQAALEDASTHPFIEAISFHSWRGYTDENLTRWAEAAQRINKPLLVGEGSIDAGAWRYPAIFEEPTYALGEIDLYIRILALCQPLSILQWQLTSDYSALSGGGVFGNKNEPLHPTQRFWNLKQLGSTPPKSPAMMISSNKSDVTCAALGDTKKGIYTIHLVNNGASREVILTGLPKDIKELKAFVTTDKRKMEEVNPVRVSNGKATFILDTTSFTTLIGSR